MSKTLEQMEAEFAASDASAMPIELEAAWTAKDQEVADYIRDYLKRPHHAEDIAREIVQRAMDMGRVHGNAISGEVPSSMTKSGNPLPFTV